MKFIQNKHSAPISPPPVRGFPAIIFDVGVTRIDEAHLAALREHPAMANFWRSCLEVIGNDDEDRKLTDGRKTKLRPLIGSKEEPQ